MPQTFENLFAERERLRLENYRLREALEPLAKLPLWRDYYKYGPDVIVYIDMRCHLAPDDVRRARELLKSSPAATKGK